MNILIPSPIIPPFPCYYLNIPPKVIFFHPKNKEVPYEGVPGNPIVSGVPSAKL